MRKLLVILLVSSLFLTQCYSQKEYLIKDYEFNTKDDLKKVVLADSTEREFARTKYSYEIESDSLIICSIVMRENYGKEIQLYTITDTLSIDKIHSVFVSDFNWALTTLVILGAGLAFLVYSISTWEWHPLKNTTL